MGNVRHRIVFGLSVGLVGILMFTLASAFVVARDYPRWLAAVVGLFAFPVAPGAWQAYAERKRAKVRAATKNPKQTSLTGGDRFWMRLAAVALVVLGPMIAVGRFDIVRATIHHGLWWVPTPDRTFSSSDSSLTTIGTGPARTFKDQEHLFAHVPPEAEAVLMIHVKADADSKQAGGSAVLAWGAGKLVVAMDHGLADASGSRESQIDKLNSERDKLKWLAIEKVVSVTAVDGVDVVASESWRMLASIPASGPSAELRRELARAPQDAQFVVAIAPRTVRDAVTIKTGALWATLSGDKILIETRIEAVDAIQAARLVDQASAALDGQTKDIPVACRDDVGKLLDHVKLAHTGAIVTGRLEVAKDQLLGMMFCAVK